MNMIVISVKSFIPSRNLNKVFTYNHMAIISLRNRSRVKASVVITRADHLFIHNYIRSLLNNISCVSDNFASRPTNTVITSDVNDALI